MYTANINQNIFLPHLITWTVSFYQHLSLLITCWNVVFLKYIFQAICMNVFRLPCKYIIYCIFVLCCTMILFSFNMYWNVAVQPLWLKLSELQTSTILCILVAKYLKINHCSQFSWWKILIKKVLNIMYVLDGHNKYKVIPVFCQPLCIFFI